MFRGWTAVIKHLLGHCVSHYLEGLLFIAEIYRYPHALQLRMKPRRPY
jgi:hypothetical protein